MSEGPTRRDGNEPRRLRDRLERAFGHVDPDIALSGTPSEAGAKAASEALRRLATRQVLGDRYVVHESVGSGGMGVVLRVWDEDLRRNLAMKVLQGESLNEVLAERPADVMDSDSVERLFDDLRKHVDSDDTQKGTPEFPAGDLDKVRRFLEEAQITGQLDHPGIVPVHEVGLDDEGRVFFTMKLVKGETLREVFKRVHAGSTEWTRTRALGILLRVCEAMSYAHAKGVIHRDLKPANIMVGAYGEVYVMDWGLAQLVDRAAADHETVSINTEFTEGDESFEPDGTTTGRVVGTPVYMSPEQAIGDDASLSPAVDVYAIGAMIYHLVAGHPPYAVVQTHSARDVLAKLRAGPPERLYRAARDAPAELVAICEKAMAREESQRYADTKLLADDLRAFLERRVVSAYETGAFAELRKWIARNRVLAAALLTLVTLSIAFGTKFGLMSRELGGKNEALTDALTDLADRNVKLDRALADARQLKDVAEVERSRVLRLLASPERDKLAEQAADLWPATIQLVPRYDAWLERARELVASLDSLPHSEHPGHRERLELIRTRASVITAEQLENDRRTHPEYDTWRQLKEGIAQVQAVIDTARAASADGSLSDDDEVTLTTLEAQLPLLQAQERSVGERVDQRRTFRFTDPDDALWHDELVRIIQEIEAFAEPATGLIDGVSPTYGWGIARRRAEALRVDQLTRSGDEARARWRMASASIAAPSECPYDGLVLAPQQGLLPLARNPRTGLWEFWHVTSGSEPRRARSGEFTVAPETGIILVLVPAGTAWIGAQSIDREKPNFDPLAQTDEAPVHEVHLEPFFLSKYELTQEQWTRATSVNPSIHQTGTGDSITGVHPVEGIRWDQAETTLRWLGLTLPTEAQWEVAARAGTSTPWWTGAARESLVGVVNMADETAAKRTGNDLGSRDWPGFDDGFAHHAPVTYGRPNPFGFFGVHGNVWEWCADLYRKSYARETTTGERTLRGGAFVERADRLRSAYRGKGSPARIGASLGVRPARAVDR